MKREKSGKYAIPESIRKFKPKGTMVKVLHGHYYVYEMKSIKDKNGKWKIKMGKMIGYIVENVGFVSNSKKTSSLTMDTYEYGQYAIAMKSTKNVFLKLLNVFGMDAINIYCIALIQAVNNYVPIRDIKEYYEQSIISLAFKTAKLGESTVSKLYEFIGRNEALRNKFFQLNFKENEGKDVAIDGHVIATAANNELSKYGYKSRLLKSEMMTLLTLYCISSKRPLSSMIVSGDQLDKTSVINFLNSFSVKNRLVILDTGFFSKELFDILKENGCNFLIPAGDNTLLHKNAIKPSRGQKKSFLYHKGKGKNAANVTIEYKEFKEDKNRRCIYYKDLSENAALDTQYLENLRAGKAGCTKQGYQEIKINGGVLVLYTDSDRSPEELFLAYKSRWTIETYYDLLDNRMNFNDLKISDYYVLQGLSFVINVSMEIMSSINDVCETLNSTRQEVLLEARRIKVFNESGTLQLRNMGQKRTITIFTEFGVSTTEPEKWDYTKPATLPTK